MTMTTSASDVTTTSSWRRISTGDSSVAVAEREAIGTSARLAVWPPGNLGTAEAAVDDVLSALDLQASRFRPDSEISWLHRAGGGTFMLSDGLAEAVSVALAAAEWTGGWRIQPSAMPSSRWATTVTSPRSNRAFSGHLQPPAPVPDGRRCGSTGPSSGSRPVSGSIWVRRLKASGQTGRPGPR